MTVAMLGMGSWGTAMALLLARRGHRVLGWTRSEEARESLRRDRENGKYLPGFEFPDLLQLEDRSKDAVSAAEIVVLAVPSHGLRETARGIREVVGARTVVNLAKGLQRETYRLPLEVLHEELGARASVASLVGPSHAEDAVRDDPTAVVATAHDIAVAGRVQEAFSAGAFRVYTNPDHVGVEMAVALKNVIALAAGIAAGLGLGDNTLGSLITRGLAEMTRLGVARGAERETFFGLAGVGDLVTTAASRHSRNRRLGEALAKGQTLEQAMSELGMVAEGVHTTAAARDLAKEMGVDMPIVEQVHAVLFAGKDPRLALGDLLARDPKPEQGPPGSGS